jgi:hypothetical protein
VLVERGLLVALAATPLWLPCPAGAILLTLAPADVERAVTEGSRSIAQEEFGEEWHVRLPNGDEVAVTTPFSRVAFAARRAAFKGEPLTERALQEQVDRGKGKLQLLVTVHGGAADFARWHQPVLRVGDREVKASFVQNERTALRVEGNRFAARNVYVFPLEGLAPQGTALLVVQHAVDRKVLLQVPLNFAKMR